MQFFLVYCSKWRSGVDVGVRSVCQQRHQKTDKIAGRCFVVRLQFVFFWTLL